MKTLQPILTELKKLERQALIRPLDYQFAKLVSSLDSDPVIILISALVSFELGKNNVCLLLNQLDGNSLFDLPNPVSETLVKTCGTPVIQWQNNLTKSSIVSGGADNPAPLVFDKNRIYLHRYWEHETNVAKYLSNRPAVELDEQKARTVINNLFDAESDKKLNWQKVAAALAATRSFAVISGGPGTGKTTTVTKLLALLVELGMASDNKPDIKLVAPTGKAAARLTESITNALKDLNCSDSVKAGIPTQAGTIHRLLGAIPNSINEYRHNRNNKLHLDILVVDEASMVDMILMSRLLDAMPDHSRLILLGDRDQLASVDAGNVLGDICMAAGPENSYSPTQTKQLEYLTGYQLNPPQNNEAGDHLCMLLKSYRFNEKSGIGHLARAANTGNTAMMGNSQIERFSDIAVNPVDEVHYQQMIRQCVQGYSFYLQKIKSGSPRKEILNSFNQFQLLCALREGKYGITGLNEIIQEQLNQAGFIQTDPTSQWYEGRPVLITRNEPGMGLYNGDIGITIRDKQTDRLRVVFEETGEDETETDAHTMGTRSFLPSRLPEHVTVYAMTIHKSQGSEFAHTIMVLPDQMNPVVTRELVYTGITRAKSKLDLYCDRPVLIRAINSPTTRASGLQSRLENN